MIKYIITLVYAMATLLIMIYPAMKIVESLENKSTMVKENYNLLTIVVTISLSLITALLLANF
ncbi:MAG: hypothetical protein HOA99_02460 [Candidatus Thioglobus sp.]|jgi:hypothetical protein|nr:hypothetical protein [Candidatus Thioglobus sp.]